MGRKTFGSLHISEPARAPPAHARPRTHARTHPHTHTTLTPDKHPCPPVGFETAIPASDQPQTHALDRSATGTGCSGPAVVDLISQIITKLCTGWIHVVTFKSRSHYPTGINSQYNLSCNLGDTGGGLAVLENRQLPCSASDRNPISQYFCP